MRSAAVLELAFVAFVATAVAVSLGHRGHLKPFVEAVVEALFEFADMGDRRGSAPATAFVGVVVG